MQRHMQNISFIAILGVLLSCSFLFSQLTNVGPQNTAITDTPVVIGKTIDDLPVCEEEMAIEEKLVCFTDAVEISQGMLDANIDDILALESESARRIAIMEAQIVWEDSRDADCSLMLEMVSEDQVAQLNEMLCLRDQNLARIEELDEYVCEWSGGSECGSADLTFGSSD